MWYVTRTIAFLSILPLLATGCSLHILGVDKSTLTTDSGNDEGSEANNGINDFSVLGASGGTDASADPYLTDGTTLTAEWVDTTGEDSYEVKVLDSTGSTTLCGPMSVVADSTSATLSGCALSNGATYRIQVTAKNSTTGVAQSAQTTFQVGPFISVGDLSVNEWGVASIPVSLSYAVGSAVSVQYVTADSTASAGSDYIHSPLSTLTIPAGQTSAMITVPIFSDRDAETSEELRVELSTPSGAGLLSTTALVQVQDDDLSPASGFAQIETGDNHTCALTSAGAVKCWGRNNVGQLGDNSVTDRAVLVDVLGLSAGVTQIVAGGAHTCALSSAGAVKCWGFNGMGQIGDNSTTSRSIPTDVFGLSSGVTQIAAEGDHTCALTSVGAVKCWGMNSGGQIGDNSTTSRSIPTDVLGLSSGIDQVALGTFHTCALTSTGAVKCWGMNSAGQIGDNSTTMRLIPTDVSGLSSGITQLAAGYSHSCALTSTGAVKCWGYNSAGQLGDNSTTMRLIPTDVLGLSSGITRIASGTHHTCAITSAGALKCWGSNNAGKIGDNSTTQRNIPTDVLGLSSGITQIAAGYDHTCALTSAGALKCWGSNAWGQIGDNSPGLRRFIPTDVSGLSSGVAQLAAGISHTCALSSTGALKCWGSNSYGQLGDNSTTMRLLPTDVSGLSSGVTQVVAGDLHTCALTSAGALKCWGYNILGQLGDNSTTTRLIPTDVSGLSSGVTQPALGGYHTCALTSAGALKCWGDNSYGELGDNSTTTRLIPTDVSGLSSGVTQLALGGYHSCALTSAGAVKCWGRNNYGQLGNNSTTNRLIPTDVLGLSSGIIQIAAGSAHTCALTSAGAVKCWGVNAVGTLGDNSTTNRLIPTDVLGLSSGIIQIAAEGDHTCALTSTSAVRCWGNNSYGELGDNSPTTRLVPTDVSGLSSGIVQVVLGGSHSCALTSSGALKCWGNNNSGQLGESYSNWVPQFVLAP